MSSSDSNYLRTSTSFGCFVKSFMEGRIIPEHALALECGASTRGKLRRLGKSNKDETEYELTSDSSNYLERELDDNTSNDTGGGTLAKDCACFFASRSSQDNRTERRFARLNNVIDAKFVVLTILFLTHGIWCLDNNILQLNIPTEEPVIDPNTVCKTFPDLSPKQYRLCAKFPDVTASAIQGIQIAIHECQHQLKEHRWNCSALEKKNKNPHSSPLLKKGYKESAFAYALSSAGVTHQVSKACSMGKLKSCGCDMSMRGEVRDKFEWGGCSHNVEFGDSFAKKFTSARETARDIHARINLHNNKAGRLVILHNVRKQCKCHGMSGSCEIKTCWKVSPDFRVAGEILKTKFHSASQIDLVNHAGYRSKKKMIQKQKNTELVYYEKSPNFCDPNPNVDSPGTTGRLCNKTSDGVGNCDTLCCGRGYNTLKVKRSERCDCKFHWCCYVICQTCTYNEWVTVCK